MRYNLTILEVFKAGDTRCFSIQIFSKVHGKSIENNGESKEELSWLLDHLVLDDDVFHRFHQVFNGGGVRDGDGDVAWHHEWHLLYHVQFFHQDFHGGDDVHDDGDVVHGDDVLLRLFQWPLQLLILQ